MYSPETCCFVKGVINSKESSERCRSYYSVVSDPEGVKYNVYNQSVFATAQGLSKNKLNALLLGKSKSHRGWTLISTEREKKS